MSKREPKFRMGQLVWIIINLKLRSAKVTRHFIDDEDGSYDYTVEFLSGESGEIYSEVDLHGSPKHCITAFTKSSQDEISHLENLISRLKDEIAGATSSYIEECNQAYKKALESGNAILDCNDFYNAKHDFAVTGSRYKGERRLVCRKCDVLLYEQV